MTRPVDPGAQAHAESSIDEEDADLVQEALNVLGANAGTWLDTGNTLFGGRSPRSLVGTDQEEQVREVLRGLKYGAFS
jgi:uncharacterized protein (DUF2384 family)